MKSISLILSFSLIVFIQICNGQSMPVDSLYLGQTPPGDMPVIFAPGVISTPGRDETVMSVSPDGTQIFFDAGKWPNRTIMLMEYNNNAWKAPSAASFVADNRPGEPCFSPDGTRVYFYAFNPSGSNNTDLCYSQKQGSTLSSIINLGVSINTAQDEYHPCMVNDSSIYFINSAGAIYRSQYKNGTYQTRIALPSNINAEKSYRDPYVSPDESYLIFRSNRTGGYGSYDNYISYKKTDGSWTNPKNLGNKINTSAEEAGGDITPDGKYMTFARNGDLYWVSASFIDEIKKQTFTPTLINQIPNRSVKTDNLFSYVIPSNTFTCEYGADLLKYTATLKNGAALPAWLSFDATTKTLSGTPKQAETDSVKITATNKDNLSATCTFNIVVSPATGIEKPDAQTIEIYPNPSSGVFNINIGDASAKNAKVEIYDFSGKLVLSKKLEKRVVDLTGYQKGIYVAKISLNNLVLTKAITIQ